MFELFGFLFFNSLLFRSVCLFLLGISIGTLLTILIYRIPIILKAKWIRQSNLILGISPSNLSSANLSIVHPCSHCPKCKTRLSFWNNLPLLSYVLLKGKCKYCKAGISIKYPLIELVTGSAFIAIGFLTNEPIDLFAGLVFVSTLVTLSFIDYENYILPTELTLPFLWLGIIFNIKGVTCGSLLNSVIGAIVGFLLLWILSRSYKLFTKTKGIGDGDIKLLAGIGAWVGWFNLLSVFLIALISSIIIILLAKVIKKRDKRLPIPFGPFLSLAGVLAYLMPGSLFQIIILK